MRDSEIFRRTLRFSVMRLVLTVVGVLIVVLLPLAAFAATAGASEVACAAATAGAFVAGLVAFFFVARYGGYLFTAAQVAMITRGVAAGELPADCLRRRRISCGSRRFLPLGRESRARNAAAPRFAIMANHGTDARQFRKRNACRSPSRR